MSRPRLPAGRSMALRVATLLAGALAGCTLQPPAATPLPTVPVAWSTGELTGPGGSLPEPNADWWRALDESALPALMGAAERSAPTIAIALARIDQARASAGLAGAASALQVNAQPSFTRGNTQAVTPDASPQSTTSLSLGFSWEIDLFGRLRHNAAAAQRRLDSAEAGARFTRLAFQAQVADTLVSRHACALLLATQQLDVQSRETTLALTRRKLAAGFSAPLDVARASTSVGEARTAAIGTAGSCTQLTMTLASLTGLAAGEVERLLAQPAPLAERPMPLARMPTSLVALPASILEHHPSVIAALRSADAAYEDVGSARAARLPSLSLSAVLGHTWIRAGGIEGDGKAWSIAPSLLGPLLDGGRASANIELGRARYAEALANLDQQVRDVVLSVETSISKLDTAQRSEGVASQTVSAAQNLFDASNASQQAGSLSIFDLEIARGALTTAQTALITAQSDRARAWIALVKATANAVDTTAAGPTSVIAQPAPRPAA